MANARKKPAARIADLKSRFARIKTAIQAVDALTADYLDQRATELEEFAGELAEMTKPEGEENTTN